MAGGRQRRGRGTAPGTASGAGVSVERSRARIQLLALLLLATLIVSQLTLPFRLAGILFALAALWTGGRALLDLSRLRRAGTRTRGHVPVGLAMGLATVMLLMLGVEVAYYPVVSELEDCRAGANTRTAQELCDDQARTRLDRIVSRLAPSAGP